MSAPNKDRDEILRLRSEGYTLDKIGSMFGISKQRVGQIVHHPELTVKTFKKRSEAFAFLDSVRGEMTYLRSIGMPFVRIFGRLGEKCPERHFFVEWRKRRNFDPPCRNADRLYCTKCEEVKDRKDFRPSRPTICRDCKKAVMQ